MRFRMALHLVYVLLAWQQSAQQPAPPALTLPQPIARVDVKPPEYALQVGDTVRLRATAYDSSGQAMPQAVIRWFASGGRFEGVVDSTGLVSAGATGTLNVAAVAALPGRAVKSTVAFARITVLPQPAAKIAVTPRPERMLAGTSLVLEAVPYAANNDRRYDRVTWKSSRPGVVDVTPIGRVTARAPGRATLTAAGGRASESWTVVVTPNPVARVTLHPDGKHAYMSTIGDRIYAIDISDPAKPFFTDSVLVDARVVNDVMTTEDGKFGVMTREGASTRKNGIVILSFEEPAHPKPIAEFTETVTGGVHSTYVYRGYVYLTDDATGSMRVIDIRDPYHPKQVARWQVERPEAGRTLHDIDVRDGLATLSYWNDGLVILDVGNGMKGGSPESPQLVAQFKYDLNALYKKVELVGGPGFIRGTHTSWRHGRYVFVGDEVFPARQQGGGPGVIGLGRAYGRLHVVDIADLTAPHEVAWFEPEDGGSHNVWIAGDTLYLGDYQGGLRVLDISGELKGDLLAQGREYAHVHTGDASGFVPNGANAWGAIYRDGLIYVPDINSGLWIVKLEPSQPVIP